MMAAKSSILPPSRSGHTRSHPERRHLAASARRGWPPRPEVALDKRLRSDPAPTACAACRGARGGSHTRDGSAKLCSDAAEETVRVALATLAALAVLASTLAACAPSQHRVAPYRDDAAVARGLEERAVAYCRAVRPDGAAPPRPFRTDGCTCWWNDGWADCCVEHDMRYWCGGPGELRHATDAELRRCVGADHSEVVAFLMYLGTRLFAGADAMHVPGDDGGTTREPAGTSGAAACVSRADPPWGRTPFDSGGGSPPRVPGSRPGLCGAPAP